MVKVVCYGVRPNEVPFFEQLNKYNFDLKLVEGLLNDDNVVEAQGMDAVILRGNCKATRQNLEKFASYGIKQVHTRAVGFNNFDLQAAKDLGITVARVPGYSPNAIAELSLTMAMSLLRHVQYTADRTAKYDFRVTPTMFSKEIRNCKVGIIGTGKIGVTEAQLFKGLGADVYGYDVFQSDYAKSVVKFVELDELLATCDIVSLHVPYFPGQNDKLVNAEFLAKMKDGAIFINTARGELQDNAAILEALKSGKLEGYGTDVFPNETTIFFQTFDNGDAIPDQTVRELIDLYPRVLVTPHVGSNTDEALSNMISFSFDNLNDILTTGTCDNLVPLPQ